MKNVLALILTLGIFGPHLKAECSQISKVLATAEKTYETQGIFYRAEVALINNGTLRIDLKKYNEHIREPAFENYVTISAPMLGSEYEYIGQRFKTLELAEIDEDVPYRRCYIPVPAIESHNELRIFRDGMYMTVLTECYMGGGAIYESPINYDIAEEMFIEMMRITDKTTAIAREDT